MRAAHTLKIFRLNRLFVLSTTTVDDGRDPFGIDPQGVAGVRTAMTIVGGKVRFGG